MSKFAVQIRSPQPEGSPWIPGIHRRASKKNAQGFADSLNKHGYPARVMRKKLNTWEPT